jgi:hypothetical protein
MSRFEDIAADDAGPCCRSPARGLQDGRIRGTVKTIKTLALALVTLTAALPAAAQPTRLYDKEVKSLVEQTKKTYERFWDAIDNNLKNTTFKGPSGEFVVKRVGEDYKNTIEMAEKRIAGTYSASDEVAKVLSEAVRIDAYVAQQGAAMKGASEWQAHANVLKQLAAQYGGTFPPTQGQTFRRYTDKEVVAATAAIEQTSKQLASALDGALKKDKATPEAARKAMVADVKLLADNAKTLGSAVKDGKPASAQVTTLLDQVKKVQGAIAGSSAANALMTQVGGLNAPLATINAGFLR